MPDLVIGGRRHNPQRTLRAAVIAIVLILASFVVAYVIYRRAVSYDAPDVGLASGAIELEEDAPGAPPRLRWADASLTWAGDLAVVRARGDDDALGAAQGRLLPGAVAAVAAGFRASIDGVVDDNGLFGGLTHGLRLQWRHRFVDDGVPAERRRALAGVVRGAAASGTAIDYVELLRAHAVLDVGAPASTSGELRTVARGLTWVVPQGGLAGGRLWVARTLSLPGLGDGGDAAAAHPVVSLMHPEGRLAWAGVGWAGLVGVVTGINAAGIVVTVQPARTRDVRITRTARPMALLARDVLEQADDLDEAIALVEATPTLGAASFVLVDGSRGTWAVVERSPSRAQVMRDPGEAAVGDVLRAAGFVDDPENDRARRSSIGVDRVKRALRLARTAPIDVAAVAAVLRDGRASDERSLPYGHRGAIDDAAAVQAVIIDPTAMVMWVADGSAAGRLRAFDLRHELRGEGDRPAPPADVVVEGGAERDRAELVRAARRELRRARSALRDGDHRDAAEGVARALALAPTLPEARYLAGVVARARGDDVETRRWWRAWLEGGPDDPTAEQDVRAVVGP